MPAARIAIGNGSCDILLAAGEALLEPGAEVVYAWPSFSVYPHLAAASGATAITVPLNERDEHDLDAMASRDHRRDAPGHRLQPEQPDVDGAARSAEIAAFVERVPRHVCVILDEAYCEFNTLDDPDASLDLLKRHPNLVLLRTFSKVYGLCGLRVGFGLCGSEEFVTAVNQVRQPFFCNAAAQAAAIEALRHQDEVDARASSARSWPGSSSRTGCASWASSPPSRRRTSAGSISRSPDGEDPPRSRRASSAGSPSAACSCAPAPRSAAPGALRVTYGTPEQNARFLRELGALL